MRQQGEIGPVSFVRKLVNVVILTIQSVLRSIGRAGSGILDLIVLLLLPHYNQ